MTKPELPSSIKILHSTYSLIRENFKDMAGHGKMGEISFHKKTIKFVDTEDSEVPDTILHEVLHGLWHNLDLDFGVSGDAEEHIVTLLATGIVTVMKDNPKLFVSLQKMLEK